MEDVGDLASDDGDLYATLKGLQRSLEFLDIQEEYIKDEMKNLKRELIRAKEVCFLYVLLYKTIIKLLNKLKWCI